MHFEGKQTINASVETIWAYFMTPEKVAECAPGFQSMEILGPDHFKPKLAVGVGAVKATFTLDVTLVDMQEPSHIAMQAHGMAVGSAVDMRSAMDLVVESDTTTTMRWTADVDVRGTIASVGSRLMEGTANKLTAKFFDCLRQTLETPSGAAT